MKLSHQLLFSVDICVKMALYEPTITTIAAHILYSSGSDIICCVADDQRQKRQCHCEPCRVKQQVVKASQPWVNFRRKAL